MRGSRQRRGPHTLAGANAQTLGDPLQAAGDAQHLVDAAGADGAIDRIGCRGGQRQRGQRRDHRETEEGQRPPGGGRIALVLAGIAQSLSLVPMSVLLAILINFGILEKHSEITALKAGGWSLYRIALPVFMIVSLLSVSLYLMQDYVVPYANIRQDSLRSKELSATGAVRRGQW